MGLNKMEEKSQRVTIKGMQGWLRMWEDLKHKQRTYDNSKSCKLLLDNESI